MTDDFRCPQLEHVDTDSYFQQNTAASHIIRRNINILRSRFRGKLILQNGDIN